MPDNDLQQLIAAIHAAPPRLVYAFTGAGSLALHWLHAVAGSSRTVLEARDCYAPRALAELLGGAPERAVIPATARAMADWATGRAAALAEGDWPLLGVACTAAIATDRARRGPDHAVVALAEPGAVRVYELTMAKGVRPRHSQEELVSRLVILAVAEACGLAPVVLSLLPGEAWFRW